MPTININPNTWLDIPLAVVPANILASGVSPLTYQSMGDLFLIWVLGDGSNNFNNVFVLRVKSNKQYCSYSTGSSGLTVLGSQFFIFIDGNLLKIVAHKTIANLSIPNAFINGMAYQIINSIVQVTDLCATGKGVTTNLPLGYGPFFDLDKKLIYYLLTYIDPFGAGVTDGITYDIYGNHVFETFPNPANTSNGTFVSHYYGVSPGLIKLDSFGNGTFFDNSTGFNNTLNIISYVATYSNTVCYDHLNPNVFGNFVLGTKSIAQFTIPFNGGFTIQSSDNNAFGVFESSNIIYIKSGAFAFDQMYNNIGYGVGGGVALWNSNLYFAQIIGGAGISVKISTDIAFTSPPNYAPNSKYPNMSYMGSSSQSANGPPSLGNSDVQNAIKKHYLINHHRPISAIGAYKT